MQESMRDSKRKLNRRWLILEVGRSFDAIDQKVKKLNDTIKLATNQTKELDKALKLDPKNTEASTQKLKLLENQVGLTTQKLALLKQKQIEANQLFAKGDISAKEYSKIQVAVMKTENEVAKLNQEIKKTADAPTLQKVDKLAQGLGKVETALKKSQKVAKTFSTITLAMVTAITASITAFTNQTLAINEQAKALGVSAEKMQLQRNLYKELTGDANNYDSALTNLRSIMNSITLGNGSGYLNILKRLGVATTDNQGNTRELSEVYDDILKSLAEMENSTLRNSLAYELFGENAINVLEVMQTSAETINELNEKQQELGITTEEQIATAEQMQEHWNNMKLEFMAVTAELAESLLPIVQALTEFVIEFIIPILRTITNWFTGMSPQQQKFTLFLLLIIILLPKIVAIFTAIVSVVKAITLASYGAAGGIGAVSAASTPLIPILWAVAAVILIVATIFAFLTGQSDSLTKSLNAQTGQMEDLQAQYSDMGSEFDVNTTQVSENSNKSSIDVNVDINAYGDTSVSQENAELVADLLAERINKELGGKI